MHNKKNDHQESRFLEAPFIRMLRMLSASLKSQETFMYTVFLILHYILSTFGQMIREEFLMQKSCCRFDLK